MWVIQKNSEFAHQQESFAVRMRSKYIMSAMCDLDDVIGESNSLLTPSGSVEFCMKAMTLQGVHPRSVDTYPEPLRGHLHRRVWRGTLREMRGSSDTVFIKPVDHKVFTGFLWTIDSHHEIADLADDLEIYCSDPVMFVSEFRYYILNGEILGVGRYDDGEDEDEDVTPDIDTVKQAIRDFIGAPSGYAMDFGVMKTYSGDVSSALVEVNDAWGSLGLYSGSMTRDNYVRLVESRWNEMCNESHPSRLME